jgi:hypothetical protein
VADGESASYQCGTDVSCTAWLTLICENKRHSSLLSSTAIARSDKPSSKVKDRRKGLLPSDSTSETDLEPSEDPLPGLVSVREIDCAPSEPPYPAEKLIGGLLTLGLPPRDASLGVMMAYAESLVEVDIMEGARPSCCARDASSPL